MDIREIRFRRRFSINPDHVLRCPMGEMSFHRDWLNDCPGDPYPALERTDGVRETVGGGRYTLRGGACARLLGHYIPACTYTVAVGALAEGEAGIRLFGDAAAQTVAVRSDGAVVFRTAGGEQSVPFSISFPFTLRAVFGARFTEAYVRRGDGPEECVGRWESPIGWELFREDVFLSTPAALWVSGELAEIRRVEWFLDAGFTQADMKPMYYEDGTPILDDGRLYLTMSARESTGGYQAVVSWQPDTADFRLEGALFFDCGDGVWAPDIASCVVYDRETRRWLVWMCSFVHGHVLGRGVIGADPRRGVHVVDVRLMEPAPEGDYTCFGGVFGDEDPALIKVGGKWHLAICRVEGDGSYHYCHFVSDDPLDGFTFVDRTPEGDKTGGAFIPTPEGCVFACGSDFNARARYDIYPINDFSSRAPIRCDFDDGGFRGWGTVIPIPCGSRRKYVWITFDRHNGSTISRWNYGNLYVFDSETFPA